MLVQLIAKTEFMPPADVPWETDADGGQALAEFAGRACYQSWTKPNPATATNAGYLQHILDVQHMSVLEHGVVSFYITGVSRALTHELVRHRHFSYSQLSQRYVDQGGIEMVTPPDVIEGSDSASILQHAAHDAQQYYGYLVDELTKEFADVEGLSKTDVRKKVRQAAQAVMPNMTETKIVVTGNYRAWRHFLDMRGALAADTEIRDLALEVHAQLVKVAPAVFGDFTRKVTEESRPRTYLERMRS